MCYAVYISTDCSAALSGRNSELLRFEKISDPHVNPCVRLLEYPYRWYVGSKSVCSCTFRHLASIELGFSEPLSWYPEEEDEIAATKELYATLFSLVSSGCRVDLVDRWEGAAPEEIRLLAVSLDEVSAPAFRLFENHKFRLQKGRTEPPAGP